MIQLSYPIKEYEEPFQSMATVGGTQPFKPITTQAFGENAGFRCEIDGTSECRLNSHHYYGRRNRSTRWYLPNGICLSANRHTLGAESAHENPEFFRIKMLDIRGKKWFEDITRQVNKTFKGTYDDVINYLNGEAENYV